MRDKPTVLVVDRENDATRALIAFLRERDLEVVWARDSEGAFHALDEERAEGLVTELRSDRIDGWGVLRRALARNPEVCAVLIGEAGDDGAAIQALQQGATDFQVRPVHLERLLVVLRRGLAHQGLVARVAEMKEMLDERFGLEHAIGHSPAFVRVAEAVRHVASTRVTVLIQGETGTGKNLVARVIHQSSPRRDQRFVRVNLRGLTEALIVSELFGVERDASSANSRPRRGRIELADEGTLFLDHVDEAPASVQVRLLRVLRDREFERVGGEEPLKVDVRIVAATHLDLEAEVEARRFRRDLLHRLGVVVIRMPPLRERREDIPLLAEAFIRDLNRQFGRKVTGLTRGVLERLMRHPWPGNVRELGHTLERMVVSAQGKRALDLTDLPPELKDGASEGEPLRFSVGMTIEEAERQLLEATLRQTGFDKPRAASLLGIGLRTLYRKIQRYGIR